MSYPCRLLICSLFYHAFFVVSLHCQATNHEYRSPELRFGASVWGGIANFDAPPTPFGAVILPPDAGPFSAGDAFQFGAVFESAFYPTADYMFALQLGLESQNVVSFTATEPTVFIIDVTERDGLLQHRLDADLTSISLAPLVAWHPQFASALRLSAGVAFAWPLSTSLVQAESIVSPEGQTYPGGVERIEVVSGEWDSYAAPRITPQLHLQFTLKALRIGGWEPRLEAGWQQSIRSLDQDVDWSMQSLRFGIGIFQSAAPTRPVIRDTTYLRDTVELLSLDTDRLRVTLSGSTGEEQLQVLPDAIYRTLIVRERYLRLVPEERSLLLVGLQVRFVQNDGTESENVSIELEEFVALERFPLLPYIFFERASAKVAPRYLSRENRATAHNLHHYFAILDSVGRRLKRLPQARLRLRGLALNADEPAALALQRARAVRDVIMRRANIDSSRFELSSAVLQTSETRAELLDELRRVELRCDNPEILQPARLSAVRRRADPPMLRFFPEVFAEAGVRDWRLEILHRDQLANQMSGSGEPPPTIDWNLQETQTALGLAIDELRLDHKLTITDLEGRMRSTDRGSIDFRRSSPATSIDTLEERFMLAWFDHDDADLLEHHKVELRKIAAAAGAVQSGEISVYGATDSTGSQAYNTRLSARRARGAINLLNDMSDAAKDGVTTTRVRMAGEAESDGLIIFDNTLPEGRMYNRRVEVILQRGER